MGSVKFKILSWQRRRRWEKYWEEQETRNHIAWAEGLLLPHQKAPVLVEYQNRGVVCD